MTKNQQFNSRNADKHVHEVRVNQRTKLENQKLEIKLIEFELTSLIRKLTMSKDVKNIYNKT